MIGTAMIGTAVTSPPERTGSDWFGKVATRALCPLSLGGLALRGPMLSRSPPTTRPAGGEPTIAVAALAMLNAMFAATDKRLRTFPLKNHGVTLT
jgi:hypothetical protein